MKQEENCDMIGMKKVQMRYRQTQVGQTEHRAEKMGYKNELGQRQELFYNCRG